MHIDDLIDPDLLATMVESGFINRGHHDDRPYSIYNYTASAQWAGEWNDATLTCRGLVVRADGMVAARPFPKFFNLSERDVPAEILARTPVAFDKLDGSLGIAYDGGSRIATRGSFHSDQAEWATEWLQEHLPGWAQPDGITTLFEIIYPANRIVVDYGERAELVLLGAIEISSGADIPLWDVDWWDGARADHYGEFESIDDARALATDEERGDDEGIVLAWYQAGGQSHRVKIKHPDYVRLHKLLTTTSAKSIWESLRAGDDIEQLLRDVPDEFYTWVQEVIDRLRAEYSEIENVASRAFRVVVDQVGTDDRKEFALLAKTMAYPSLLFSMLDGKDYSDQIWKQIRPEHERPFVDA